LVAKHKLLHILLVQSRVCVFCMAFAIVFAVCCIETTEQTFRSLF